MSPGRVRLIDMAAVMPEEEDRLATLGVLTAAEALVGAVERLAEQEADRIGVPFLDPTYHGCDPAWRDALDTARDINAVLGREDA